MEKSKIAIVGTIFYLVAYAISTLSYNLEESLGFWKAILLELFFFMGYLLTLFVMTRLLANEP